MNRTTLTGLIALGCALVAPLAAHAQDVDWNAELTQDVLRERGYSAQPGYGSKVSDYLETEMYVVSERLSRSNVKVLKRENKFPGVVEMSGYDQHELSLWPEYIQIIEVQNPDGSTVLLRRNLSPQEVEQLKLETAGTPRETIAAEMTAMSDGLILLGGALRQGIGNSSFADMLGEEGGSLETTAKGGGESLCDFYLQGVASIYQSPHITEQGRMDLDMRTKGMMGADGKLYPVNYVFGPACMLAGSAKELESLPAGSSPEAFARAQDDVFKAVNQSAKLVGDETVDGHTTKHIKVEGLDITQTMDDGSEATINQVSIWLDPQYYVRRRTRMEGTIKQGRKSEPFFMERENQDYRRVDETYLYEPYRQILKMGGMMNDKQRRELAKAQAELEKAKAQLAQMPPAQRAMVEGMMASQMAQLDNLVDNGAATVEIITTNVELNPGFADTPIITFSGSAHSETLVRMIQTDLAQLGFEPGPATGKINKATSDAISAYQASRNMAVNGAPSPELAAALQAEADAL